MKPPLQRLGDVLQEQVGGALGRGEGDRVWDRHVQDSLTALPLIESCRRLVDIGSGAGLPGLPLAMASPRMAVTLVEARAARAGWLRSAVDRLALVNVDVLHARWEAAPDRNYDIAIARALAAPRTAVEIVRRGPTVPRLLLYVTHAHDLPEGRFWPGVVDSERGVLDIDLR